MICYLTRRPERRLGRKPLLYMILNAQVVGNIAGDWPVGGHLMPSSRDYDAMRLVLPGVILLSTATVLFFGMDIVFNPHVYLSVYDAVCNPYNPAATRTLTMRCWPMLHAMQ